MYSDDRLNDIYDKTDGRCHICHKKLSWSNYGVLGTKGAWEVDHSNPRANGGTDRLTNLYAACIPCNRSKGHKGTRSQRAKYGLSRAPYSAEKKAAKRLPWIIAGTVITIGLLSISPRQIINQVDDELNF